MILKEDNNLDVRLQRRDTSPLPEGAWLRFQAINRGKDPSYNYRWLLYENGLWSMPGILAIPATGKPLLIRPCPINRQPNYRWPS